MELTRRDDLALKYRLTLKQDDLLGRLARLGLAVTIICAPIRYNWVVLPRPQPPLYGEYTNFYFYLTDICLILTLGLWLVRLALGSHSLTLRPRWLTFSLASLCVTATVSSLFSVDPALSWYHSVRLLLLFGLYLYLINNPPRLAELVAAFGMQVTLQATIGIVQALHQHSLGLAFLQELRLDPAESGISIVWAAGERSLRAYGLTDHPNILGGSLAIALLLLAAGYAVARPNQRIWLSSLFALGALALLATFSRSAWLGLTAGLALLFVWTAARGDRASLTAWAGLVGGAGLILIPFLWSNAVYLGNRLNFNGSFTQATPENQAIDERVLLINQAKQILAKQPLTGIGLAAYPQAFRKAVPDYSFDYQPPHMVLLEAATETGLPGGGVYLMVMAIPWLLLLNHWQTPNQGASWLPLAGISAALLAISVISFLDYYPWLLNSGLLLQWLIWGIWGAWYQAAYGEGLC